MERKKQNVTDEHVHRIVVLFCPMFLRSTGLPGTLKSQQVYVYFRDETKWKINTKVTHV